MDPKVRSKVGVDVRLHVPSCKADHPEYGRVRGVIVRECIRTNKFESLVAGMARALIGIDQMQVDEVALQMLEVGDDVVAEAVAAVSDSPEPELVSADPANQRVLTNATSKPVCARAACQDIVASEARQYVVNQVAIDPVVAPATDRILDVAVKVTLKYLALAMQPRARCLWGWLASRSALCAGDGSTRHQDEDRSPHRWCSWRSHRCRCRRRPRW